MRQQTPFFLAAFAAVPAAPGATGSSTPALGGYTATVPGGTPTVQATASGATQSTAPAGGSLLSGLPDVNLSWSGYFEALAILCFVLALLLAVLWLFKRRGGNGFFASSAPGLRLETRLALGPKKWLMVVRYLDRRLVLGVTDDSIRLLTELRDEEAPGTASARPAAPAAAAAASGGIASPARKTPAAKQAEDQEAPLSFADLLKDKADPPA